MEKYNLRNRKREIGNDESEKNVRLKTKKIVQETPESLTKILDLNDDCFNEIFSYLSYNDVISALQVCIRFEDRARDIFKRRKYKLGVFCEKANASEHLLRHVGPALVKLEMFFCEDMAKNQRTIDIVSKHCVDNLTEITLHCLTKRTKLSKPFGQVHKLTLSFCDLIGHFQLTKWFPNLSSVTYNYTKNLKKFVKQNVPTMHTLNINGVILHAETIAMLLSNPQIKNLSLNFVSHSKVTIQRSLFTAIDKALPELQTLNLTVRRGYNFETPYQPLHFKHLKALRIENYTSYPNYGLINHLAISPESLERLQLRFSDVTGDPQSYDCITKYKNLRQLQVMPVQHSLKVDVILMLINQLPLLERIEQTADFTNVLSWAPDEVANFDRNSKQLMELAFIFVYEAKSKFNRSLNFMQAQFIGTKWLVKTEEREAIKIFDTDGIDGQNQKQLVIRVRKHSHS